MFTDLEYLESLSHSPHITNNGTKAALGRVIEKLKAESESAGSVSCKAHRPDIDPEILWDENSELVDDDIDSLQTVAGHNIMRKSEFIKVIQNLLASVR